MYADKAACFVRLAGGITREVSKERFRERQAEAARCAARLAEAVAQPATDLTRDATIQRFEFTFETVWKALKLYLARQGYDSGGPRSTLKKAFEEDLISSSEEASRWLEMLDDRNMTTHAYDEALAQRIYGRVVSDYAAMLGRMADRLQTLEWD